MAVTGLVGNRVTVQISLYEADGFTPLSGVAGEIESVLTRSTEDGDAREDAPEAVAIGELDGHPGEYVAVFTPLATRTYTLTLRHPGSMSDQDETIQVETATLSTLKEAVDDVAAVVDVDMLIDVSGTDNVTVGVDWFPIFRFRRKSTLAPLSLEEFTKVDVLAVDGVTIIESILEGNIEDLGLGRYRISPAAAVQAGTIWLRPTFVLEGDDNVYSDFFRVQVFAEGAEPEAGAAGAGLARVYTCPTALTRARHQIAAMEPEDVWDLIRQVSAQIDGFTHQWFNADLQDWYFDGRDRCAVEHKSRIPIVYVDAVTVLGARTLRQHQALKSHTIQRPYEEVDAAWSAVSGVDVELVPADWALKNRILLRTSRGVFPGGYENIEVHGAFGWVDNPKAVTTESLSELDENSTALRVVDVEGFETRDVVDVVGASGSCRVILTGIDPVEGRLIFDALGTLPAAIEAGAEVRTFGQVPRPIEELAGFLFAQARAEQQSYADGEVPIHQGQLRSEIVDDYKWEVFNPAGLGLTWTGNMKYDQIIRRFSMPGGVKVP